MREKKGPKPKRFLLKIEMSRLTTGTSMFEMSYYQVTLNIFVKLQ